WHGRREKETPARADIPFHRLGEGLDKLEDAADYCLIDSSPTINEQTAILISLSDLILIPVRPSPTDLWSVGETVELVKKAGKPFLFVINQAKGNATITAQAVARPLEAWSGGPNLHCGSGGVCVLDDRRDHRSGGRERAGQRRGRGPVERNQRNAIILYFVNSLYKDRERRWQKPLI
ncbi:MAG: 'Cobyrinic acid a,c-diamide synthase, partial [Leptospirillum sp. Group IV 'UBA BS']